MKSKLDEKNFDLVRVLYNLKQSLDIYRVIAVNAKEITEAGSGKTFFAYIQGLVIESCVVNICKLFEIEKDPYELNSIPGVIEHLQREQIACKDSEPIAVFASENGVGYRVGHEVEVLSVICKKFYDKNKAHLKRFKSFRDKRVAHAEHSVVNRKTPLPSYAVMDFILTFGVDFYSAVQSAYIGTYPVQIKDENKTLVGLLHLLKIRGIKNIKSDFND
jgi:hypothetical protein